MAFFSFVDWDSLEELEFDPIFKHDPKKSPKIFENALSRMPKLKKVTFNGLMHDLNPDIFKDSKIEELILVSCEMKQLENGIFQHLGNLKKIVFVNEWFLERMDSNIFEPLCKLELIKFCYSDTTVCIPSCQLVMARIKTIDYKKMMLKINFPPNTIIQTSLKYANKEEIFPHKNCVCVDVYEMPIKRVLPDGTWYNWFPQLYSDSTEQSPKRVKYDADYTNKNFNNQDLFAPVSPRQRNTQPLVYYQDIIENALFNYIDKNLPEK